MTPDPPDTHVVTAGCGHTCEADDVWDDLCPACQPLRPLPPGLVRAPEGSDPWEGTQEGRLYVGFVPTEHLREMEAARDQARRWAMHLEAREAALVEVVEALTHEYYGTSTRCVEYPPMSETACGKRRSHPVHRTLAVIAGELDGPEETP